MANFNQATVAGEMYQRCYSAVASNPKGGTPEITFWRQNIITIGGNEIVTEASPVKIMLIPGSEGTTFPLYNPATGEEVIGQSRTYGDVYQILWSLFIDRATAQDAAVAAL